MPKVSVVMTVFNTAPYLRSAINSILNQTFTDFEFIIVDDASTDSSRDIINSYSDTRIVRISNKKNIGLTSSLNKALKIARGLYIARMDSDDVSTPDRLKTEYDFLESHKDIFLVSGSFRYINSKDEILSSHIMEMDSEQVASSFPLTNPIHHPTVMWNHDHSVHYREKALYCEDRDLWLRLSQQGKKFHVLKDIILLYRIHSESVSISKKKLQEAFIHKVNEWYYEREKNGSDTYESFDADLFASKIKSSAGGGGYTSAAKELKFYLKESDNMQVFRLKFIEFRREYGVFVWLPGYIFFLISFLPLILLRIMRTRIWPN